MYALPVQFILDGEWPIINRNEELWKSFVQTQHAAVCIYLNVLNKHRREGII